MRGFTDHTKFSPDLSFMTDEDWRKLDSALDQQAKEREKSSNST